MQKCRSCGAAIRWARTVAGKLMPVDAAPSIDGNLQLIGDQLDSVVYLSTAKQAELFDVDRYTSHFATCPNAVIHRK